MITHCVSAARTPVVATVNTIPNLILSSGTATASQTVDQNKPITAIIYTAASATIALSSGTASLPNGISGIPNGTTFTISGTPSTAGTFTYTVMATHMDGGCTSTLSGVITVKAATPSYAASTQTWTFGSSTLTWSDRINATSNNCQIVNKMSNSGTQAEYAIVGGKYYYNWYCLNALKNIWCPFPWRVPSKSDYDALIAVTNINSLLASWGASGWIRNNESSLSYSDNAYDWSTTMSSDHPWHLDVFSTVHMADHFPATSGLSVRCVK
jgi:hypothetical protein